METIIGILGSLVLLGILWLIKKGADILYVEFIEKVEIRAERWLEKAFKNFDEEINDYVDNKLNKVTVINDIIEWLNENASDIIKDMKFKNEEQLENWVVAHLEEVINEKGDKFKF
mgnify:CR=1 FL=1